jgi:hypothetical protein
VLFFCASIHRYPQSFSIPQHRFTMHTSTWIRVALLAAVQFVLPSVCMNPTKGPETNQPNCIPRKDHAFIGRANSLLIYLFVRHEYSRQVRSAAYWSTPAVRNLLAYIVVDQCPEGGIPLLNIYRNLTSTGNGCFQTRRQGSNPIIMESPG